MADAQWLVDLMTSEEASRDANLWQWFALGMRADCRKETLTRLETGQVPPDRWDEALSVFDDGRYQRDLRDAVRDHREKLHGGRLVARLAKIAVTTADAPLAVAAFSKVHACVIPRRFSSFDALDEDLKAAGAVIVEAWPTLDERRRVEAGNTLRVLGVDVPTLP